MSNPALEIHIASEAKIADIERLLAVDLSRAKIEGRTDLVPGKLGWIRIYINPEPLPYYGNYAASYRFQIQLDTASQWNEVRLVLATNLCEWLIDEFPGDYLCRLDTGDVIFNYKNSGLVIQSRYRKFFEANNVFSGKQRFEDLEPV